MTGGAVLGLAVLAVCALAAAGASLNPPLPLPAPPSPQHTLPVGTAPAQQPRHGLARKPHSSSSSSSNTPTGPPTLPPDPDPVEIFPLSQWFYFADADRSLAVQLTERSADYLEARRLSVAKMNTSKEAWTQRNAESLGKFKDIFAPLPPADRGVPPVREVGVINREADEYELHKLLIDTRDGLYVPAALMVPYSVLRSPEKKHPGILYVSGHTPNAFRQNMTWKNSHFEDYQLVQLNLVKRGFVVLSIDPLGQGERRQYPDLFPITSSGTAEQEYFGRQLFLTGQNANNFFIWDEIRALDYLESLPYIDKSRLGVHGCSGGGTQASNLGMIDSRIHAASIACYISTHTIDRYFVIGGKPCAQQVWPGGIKGGLDKADLVEIRAPKPTQVIITSDDQTFPAAGGRMAVQEATKAFEALGDKDALDSCEAIFHHGYITPNRECVYRFFLEHMRGLNRSEAQKQAAEVYPEEFAMEDLWTTSTGNVWTAPEVQSRVIHNFTAEIVGNLSAKLAARRTPLHDPPIMRDLNTTVATVTGYEPPTGSSRPMFMGMVQAVNSTEFADLASAVGLVERYLLRAEGQCKVVVTLMHPHDGKQRNDSRGHPLVAKYYSAYWQSFQDGNVTLQLASLGYLVVQVDLCGFGQVGENNPFWLGLLPLTFEQGRSLVALNMADMVRVHEFLEEEFDVGSTTVSVATDGLGTALLHTAVLDPKVTGHISAIDIVPSYAPQASERLYSQSDYHSWIHGVLRHYDRVDLMGRLAMASHGLRLQLVNPKNEMLETLERHEADAALDYVQSMYALHLADSHFELVCSLKDSGNYTWVGERIRSFAAPLRDLAVGQ